MTNNVSPSEQFSTVADPVLREHLERIKHYARYSVSGLISEIKHYDDEMKRAQVKLDVMRGVLIAKAKGELK